MKGNTKKLSVLVGVPVIALFIMVDMVSAGPAIPYGGINGVYAVTGISSCSPANIPTSPGVFEGDYTFKPDGTVSVSNGFVRNIPGVGPTMPVKGEFKYTVTRDGRIEFQYPWGGFQFGTVEQNGNITYLGVFLNIGPSHGVISQDGKTITITCGPPIGPLYLILEDGSRVGGNSPTPDNPDLWCVTTSSGIRIR